LLILFYFVFFGKTKSGNEPLGWLAFQRHPIKKNEVCSEAINKGDARRNWEGNNRNESLNRTTYLKNNGRRIQGACPQ